MDVTLLMYVVLAASVLALGFAYYFYRNMLGKDEGTELMKTIASHVRKGAMAYLKQQYKVVTIVFVILAVVFAVMAYFNLQNGIVWFAFLTGGFFSAKEPYDFHGKLFSGTGTSGSHESSVCNERNISNMGDFLSIGFRFHARIAGPFFSIKSLCL